MTCARPPNSNSTLPKVIILELSPNFTNIINFSSKLKNHSLWPHIWFLHQHGAMIIMSIKFWYLRLLEVSHFYHGYFFYCSISKHVKKKKKKTRVLDQAPNRALWYQLLGFEFGTIQLISLHDESLIYKMIQSIIEY